MKNWNSPNTIIGSAAEGDKYFARPDIERILWRELGKGNHILFSAPRRVGKSSIMKYMAKNCDPAFKCYYQNISSDATTQEFYKRIFDLTMLQLKSIGHARTLMKKFIKKFRIGEITTTGVKLEKEELNYKDLLLELLSAINEPGIKIVLFLDEFPDVINNISDYEGNAPAKDVLQTLRSLRHDDRFKGSFTLVLAGSIGLDHIVKKIDRTITINDLYTQHVHPLTHQEAENFIHHLTKDATMQLDDKCIKYILDRLQQPIPYYIQLIIEQCDDILFSQSKSELTIEVINLAWNKCLDDKNFSDWEDRLRTYFPDDFEYYIEILKVSAHENSISLAQAFDIGTNFNLGESYKGKIDDVLVKDGYLFENKGKFVFTSPLLQDWWKKRYPIR